MKDKTLANGLSSRLAALNAILMQKDNKGFVQNNLQITCKTLPQNDRALAYEIAFGTYRMLNSLDEKLKALMKHLPEEPCRTILEISIYQLLCMRIPPYAVVNSAVELTRKVNKHNMAKFVNAILRNAIRKNFAKIENTLPPSQWIRVNVQKTNANEVALKLNLQNPTILFDRFILIDNAAEVLKNSLFEKGFYSFQNPASYFILEMCEIKAGYKILDACAAPGGKTAMLAEEYPNAFFIASDYSEKRTAKMPDLQNRLGLKNVEIVVARAEDTPFLQTFDCIIADVPCSNMGVVNRRPEALQNRSKEKLETFAAKQFLILQSLASMVKTNGIIVYSVCSQEKEESTAVVQKFLDNNPNFIQENSIYTSMPEVDNFFVAKLRKM